MYGEWICQVETPFGEEQYIIILEKDRSAISHQNKIIAMDITNYSKNSFFLEKKMDFPIPCTVSINGIFSDEIINGSITIDEYLKTNFTGVK